jgi:hypothetical protein
MGKRHLYPDKFKECDSCHGKGTVHCSSCNGVGYTEETRSGYDSNGRYYSQRERVRHSTCFGTGQRQCGFCGGTGDQLKYS